MRSTEKRITNDFTLLSSFRGLGHVYGTSVQFLLFSCTIKGVINITQPPQHPYNTVSLKRLWFQILMWVFTINIGLFYAKHGWKNCSDPSRSCQRNSPKQCDCVNHMAHTTQTLQCRHLIPALYRWAWYTTARPIATHIFVGMDAWMTSQLNVALFRKLLGSLMA